VVDYLKKVAPGLAPMEGTPSQPPAGMYIGSVEDYLQLRTSGLPVKTALIPGFDKAQRITETQGWALTLYKSVPEKELYKVQELAFYLLDFPQQRRWAEQTPYLAAHLKVFDNPFYRRERLADHSNLRVFLNSVGKSKIVDTSGRLPERYTSVGRMLGAVLRGEKTPQDLISPR
jgi:ABC-type glycerol-3-phosphate transport system substrate-binding protein